MRKVLYIFIALFMFIGLAACEEITPTPDLKDIVDTAVDAGDFDLLAQALTEADLVQALKGEGPFTVFAPNDQAFLDLMADLSLDAEGLLALPNLADILLYHVLAGEFLAADVIAQAPFEAETLSGEMVMITVVDGVVYVNDAKVVAADVMANNGVIHVIDKVLLPPQDTTPPLLFGLGDVVVNIGDAFNPMEGVTAIDDVDGNITDQVVVTGDYNLEVAGIYELTYTVSDAAGNVTSQTRTLIVRVKPESELFVTNGDFSEPLDGTWTHWAGEGGSSTVQIVDGVLQYNITANGSQWWSSQFSQPNLTIPQGKSFKLVFEARADVARGMVVKLEDATYFGYVDEALMLTTEWVTYELEFFVTRPTITNGKLIFGGGTVAARGLADGNALTTIYIDNVRFVELELGEDTEAPVVHGLLDVAIQVGDIFDPLTRCTVSDNMDFDLTVNDIVITGEFDNMVPGEYELTYTLTDASGNVGVYTRTVTVLEGLVPSTLVLVNPDFEIEQLTPYPQPATQGWGWHPHTSGGRFDAKIMNGMAIIDVYELGIHTYGVQFYQQNLIITQGQIYKVTFDARADIARPIQVALEQGTTRRFDEIVDLTTEWTTYTLYIDHILPGYTNGKFAFFLGQVGLTSVPTTIYLDNIVIETLTEIVDETQPVLRGVSDYMITVGTPFDPLRGVTVFDQVDKSLTVDDILIEGEVNVDIVGVYDLTYLVTDASGNEAEYTRQIHVVEANEMLESTLVLVNADFEIDQSTPYAQPAMLGWGWHGAGSFTVAIENGIMTQVVTNVGTVPHGTQFYQQNLIVESQAMYRVTFDAKADDARAIRISLEQGTTLRDFQIVPITEDWATIQFTLWCLKLALEMLNLLSLVVSLNQIAHQQLGI
jgi:uncharacterized surface protein with fasciclin (FAS1) repeats